MRRALLAITGLAAGTTALVVLKGSPGASQVAQEPAGRRSRSAPPGRTSTRRRPGAASGGRRADRPPAAPDAAASRTPSAARTSTGAGTSTRPRRPRPRTTTTRAQVDHPHGSPGRRSTTSTATCRCRSPSPVTGSSTPSRWSCPGRCSPTCAATTCSDRYSGTAGEVVQQAERQPGHRLRGHRHQQRVQAVAAGRHRAGVLTCRPR